MPDETGSPQSAKFRSVLGETQLNIRSIDMEAPWRWLGSGWRDLRAAPHIGLFTGAMCFAGAAILAALLSRTGWISLMLALGCGFALVGPLLAAGLYDTSRRLEQGQAATLRTALLAGATARGQLGFFGFVLFLIFFAWINVAFLLFMLFYGDRPPQIGLFTHTLLFEPRGISLLVTGTAIGACLAAIVYMISVVSVPLLLVEDIDSVTAGITSVQAVLQNPGVMALWAVLIVGLMAVGLATLGLGLIITFPLVGHASWHAFRDIVRIGPEH